MLEWLKRHAWKACIRQKRIASSNLAHSANKTLKINGIFADFSGFIFTFIGKPIVVILAKSGTFRVILEQNVSAMFHPRTYETKQI